MKIFARTFAIVTIAMLAGACASKGTTHMTMVPAGQEVKRPAPGKALVYFVRPSNFGWAVKAPIYDGDDYIGTMAVDNHIAYQAAPGRHLFMVIGESADFMQADLRAGKTYYASVVARMGVWKARFSFVPQNGQTPWSQVEGWIRNTTQVRVNDEGRAWAKANAASVKEKREKYLPAWQQKADKQILKASSGR